MKLRILGLRIAGYYYRKSRQGPQIASRVIATVEREMNTYKLTFFLFRTHCLGNHAAHINLIKIILHRHAHRPTQCGLRFSSPVILVCVQLTTPADITGTKTPIELKVRST